MREPIEVAENNKIERHGDDGRHQRLRRSHKAVNLFRPDAFKGTAQ